MGFQRGLNHLLYLGVDVGVMVTDRSPSIRKLMRESCANIRHEYVPWHVNKSMYHKQINTYPHIYHLVASKMEASYLMLLMYWGWCFQCGVSRRNWWLSKKKDHKDLLPWVRSISNHLYWSCSSSHGDEEVTMKLCIITFMTYTWQFTSTQCQD